MCRDLATRSLAGGRSLAGDRGVVSEPRSVTSSLGTLTKLNYGLLGKTLGGDTDQSDPDFLDPSEWTLHGDDNLNLNVPTPGSAAKLLSFIPGDVENKNAFCVWDKIGRIFKEIMVYDILDAHETEPEIESIIWVGNVVFCEPNNLSDTTLGIMSRYRVLEGDRVGDNQLVFSDFGVSSVVRTLSTLRRDTGQRAWRISWARNDGEAAVFDGYAAQEDNSVLELTVSHSRTEGFTGLHTRGSENQTTSQRCRLYKRWAVAGRHVTVLDAPAGSTARVLDEDGNELSSGVEAGGEISIDMMILGDQVWSIDPATLLPDTPGPADVVTIEVLNSLGQRIAILTPAGALEGVWGGEVYSFAECS